MFLIPGIFVLMLILYIRYISQPKTLLILGKAFHASDSRGNMDCGCNWSIVRDLDYLPTFGNPASDILFTAGLGGIAPDAPAFATGRIAARAPHHIADYLNKVDLLFKINNIQ